MLKAGGAALVVAAPLPLLFERQKAAASSKSRLVADPAGLLDLAEGFRYRVLERVFDPMSDGYRVPARPDGMACFSGPGDSLILMRNHENDRNVAQAAYDVAPSQAYDPLAFGGVTRLVVDAKKLERLSSNLVLTGTLRNCAGGESPWGWLSCEESMERGHGYVFLCRSDASQVQPPARIKAYGRFNHEAVCIDPTTKAAYLTEDRPDGCLYRFMPTDPNRPFEGKLQALSIAGSPRFECADHDKVGQRLRVEWLDLREGDPADDTLRIAAQALGAARFRRGEGMFFARGAAYACSTTGGKQGVGQLFRIHPESGAGRAALELVAESPGDATLDCPDNITVAPWGDVYMAEDGSGEQFIRALTPTGKFLDVARNARGRGEFAGVCFSPDGKVLFLNFQIEGLTVAVHGPFDRLSRS